MKRNQKRSLLLIQSKNQKRDDRDLENAEDHAKQHTNLKERDRNFAPWWKKESMLETLISSVQSGVRSVNKKNGPGINLRSWGLGRTSAERLYVRRFPGRTSESREFKLVVGRNQRLSRTASTAPLLRLHRQSGTAERRSWQVRLLWPWERRLATFNYETELVFFNFYVNL